MITVEQLFQYAVDHKASDIHCVAGRLPVVRIDGELHEMDGGSVLTAGDVQGLVTALVSKEKFAQFVEVKELDAAYTSQTGERFRLNFHIERGNMSFVARLIPKQIPTLEDLRTPEIVKKLLELPHGLILVTGPTGSGKSTSLAAMVDRINAERAETIVTFEDPIEFIFSQKKSVIRQRQLGEDTRSFAEGLKHVLRQDPDIIMVGEMR
ncbi:MAG: ATPase, T2SS/T4P/T4SS family, partial [bacterium]|nr:ATPase, T2SS/T4P/T4SS family [bacterium]